MNKPENKSLFTRIFKPLSIVSLLTVGLLTGCGVDRGADVNRYDGVYNVNDYTGRVNQFQGRNYDATGRAVPFTGNRMGTNNNRYGTGAGVGTGLGLGTDRGIGDTRLGTGMGTTGNIYDNNFMTEDRINQNMMNRGTTTRR
ncbi:hypothetical protein [Ammoniphilus sp. CFH 90114]|uniref:hypothetical protein n=1 Tax=Ammoniphilus sp. CFH 90114 TaxID=2493665 RepID=UPI00100F6178|nr:hypothetical protein [Ammoniphilus sp. CFH 90114]RXT04129.1 hypothetical protein EIZ39_21355 [Ammoniphilus sp. CFH 90114]